MKVSLFVTCLVDQLFPKVGLDAVRLLERLGVEVSFDPRQTCCGQPAFNSGYRPEARKVADHLLEIYAGSEWVVVPSGSCTAMIRALPTLFETESKKEQARDLANRTLEISDFLYSILGVRDTGARFEARATYHDSCHLLRELGVASQPRELLSQVVGLELIEMSDSDRCCGFGGTFAVKFPEISTELGMDKILAIEASGADYVIANDSSCLMHLQGLLSRRQSPVKTLHTIEVLAAQGN